MLRSPGSVGRAIPHDSAYQHVTGKAVYVDDRARLHGQLYAYVAGSEIAHGRIARLDLRAVHAAEGVVDVVTAAEIPGQVDIGAVFPGDPLLVDDLIEYVGQPLFAVLATSYELARKAARAAQVDYARLTPVLALQQAIEQKFYVRPPHRMQRGDAAAALAQAAHRLQGALHVGGQEHFYLEGQAALAVPQEDGGVTVYTSNQNPTEAQKLVAEVLAVPQHKVNVVTRRMGGGFGGKETQAAAWACLAALFARRSGRAVACRLARRDDMVMTGKRHPFYQQYDVGYAADGQLTAIRYVLAAQCGNSPDLSDAVVDRAMFHCDNAYYVPHICIDGLRCKTHTVSNTAFRGFGGPQGMLAMENVIDHLAFELQLDPLEVRKRNLYDTDARNVTPYHQTIETFSLPRIISQLETQADYWARRAQVDAFNRQSPVLKKGLALTPVKFGISFTVAHLNQAGALIHIYTDGSIHLNHGGTEMGQGLMTKVAQIVAEELGVDFSRIAVSATRTDKVPNTAPTAASAGTDLNGMAARNAARTLKQRLCDFVCERYAVSADEVVFQQDRVHIGQRTCTFAEVAKQAWLARVPLSSTGFYKTPKIHYDRDTARGRPFLYYANGAAVSEVVIDSLTGESKLLRADILHDVGNSINPALDIGQIEGGYLQGVGWLTSEELKWDEHGRLLTDSAATYKIPAIADAPPIFNVRLLDAAANTEPTIFRSKAVGEPPLMLAISAWCAIRDAIAATAPRRVFPQLHAPATPEQILHSITQLRAAG